MEEFRSEMEDGGDLLVHGFDREDSPGAERVILVAVCTGSSEETEQSLDELERLADTAGAVTVGRVVQNRMSIHPGTYVGTGKLPEIRAMMDTLHADSLICDDELSPVQMRVLQRELECKVLDRTLLILDIFAAHATTSEGKLQVELAQLQYRMARLSGLGKSLSRLGGGIGTRGPGEKKLETDRRMIRARISRLKEQLSEVKRHRELLRENRQKTALPVVALVGYTNAGKSTLLNALTGADVLAEDKLFATLDPATRVMEQEDGQQILITDTVGFIRKLPHHLVEAFRSTLEEARYADLIVHVADSSSAQLEEQMHVVYETLRELNVTDQVIVTVFNKCDLSAKPETIRDFRADYTLTVSAKTGEGLEQLRGLLKKLASDNQILLERLYPYDQAGKIQLIRKYGRLLEEEYREDGIYVRASVRPEIYGRI